MSTPLPEGQQGAKAENTDKIQAAINQTAWVLPPPFVLALEITIISGTKNNLVQVEWDDKKVLIYTQTIEGIAYENDKNYRLKKQML
jgi:hypothetical protein